MRDYLESEGSFSSMPPLDAMWDSLQVTSNARSHPLHHDTTSLYKSNPRHRKGNYRGWPPLPRYAFRQSSARESFSASSSDRPRQPDVRASTPKSERSVNSPRSEQVPASSVSAVPSPPAPPNLATIAPQQPPNVSSTTAPGLGPYMVAGPWAPALHPHLPLMASGHLPPVGMPTQVLTHSMLPTTAPSVIPLVMYNTPQPLMGVLGAGGMQVPLPPQENPVKTLDKVDQSFNATQCLQYLQRPTFTSSLVWDLLAEMLEEEELPEILEELRREHQQCAGWFASDPEYRAVCSVLEDLIDSTVCPVVPGVVSEVIDELHRVCVHSPRTQWQDAVLSTALDAVDGMMQEIVEEEVIATVHGEQLEVCVAGLVRELVREVAEDSYHEVVLTTGAHRSEEAVSFVSDYLVEQLIFEEALDLSAEGQPSTLLTREAIHDYLLDSVIFSSVLDLALSESRGP